ncbi:hypothetical protein HYPSUDRAFT_586633 [Hypholoma sublateritium FD-334 SS-4]|uniref:Uncharacterized protein n=1 Tax=Hypholoma sublateritium (strain FD-334 SS-4) TaxID=945553 RepID=A0A0D2P3X6_HYPSF|nr:hypothetical protein HYPSUDRAFT_586633 [Hypholoma sublateritium FD-334 SS-4]
MLCAKNSQASDCGPRCSHDALFVDRDDDEPRSRQERRRWHGADAIIPGSRRRRSRRPHRRHPRHRLARPRCACPRPPDLSPAGATSLSALSSTGTRPKPLASHSEAFASLAPISCAPLAMLSVLEPEGSLARNAFLNRRTQQSAHYLSACRSPRPARNACIHASRHIPVYP